MFRVHSHHTTLGSSVHSEEVCPLPLKEEPIFLWAPSLDEGTDVVCVCVPTRHLILPLLHIHTHAFPHSSLMRVCCCTHNACARCMQRLEGEGRRQRERGRECGIRRQNDRKVGLSYKEKLVLLVPKKSNKFGEFRSSMACFGCTLLGKDIQSPFSPSLLLLILALMRNLGLETEKKRTNRGRKWAQRYIRLFRRAVSQQQ